MNQLIENGFNPRTFISITNKIGKLKTAKPLCEAEKCQKNINSLSTQILVSNLN
jgi:hypothetical protein